MQDGVLIKRVYSHTGEWNECQKKDHLSSVLLEGSPKAYAVVIKMPDPPKLSV